MSVLDPSNTSYYISEVIDAGRDEPLFMVFNRHIIFLSRTHRVDCITTKSYVKNLLHYILSSPLQVSLEDCPQEMFIHGSANKCWEMVRDRANQEITRQHKSGRLNLPPLQPPGSLDGFEMFGFTSPSIVQVNYSLMRNWLNYSATNLYRIPFIIILWETGNRSTGSKSGLLGVLGLSAVFSASITDSATFRSQDLRARKRSGGTWKSCFGPRSRNNTQGSFQEG